MLTLDVVASVIASFFALSIVSIWETPWRSSLSLSWFWLACSCVASLVGFLAVGTYCNAIRHTTLREVGRLLLAVTIKEALLVGAVCVLPWLAGVEHAPMPLLVLLFVADTLFTAALLLGIRMVMIVAFDRIRAVVRQSDKHVPVLVYGASDKSVSLVKRLDQSPHYEIRGFIVPQGTEAAHRVAGLPVHAFTEGNLPEVFKESGAKGVLFARENDARQELGGLVHGCSEMKLKVFLAPAIDEVAGGKLLKTSIRQIKIEDLLGRDEIKISLDAIKDSLRGKTVMVTGAAGSIGSELCRQLAGFGIKRLIMFDNAETPMHNVRLEFEERFPDLEFVPVIGDVRIMARLDFVFRKFHPQVVFHAAAYKHVPLMEENPCEAVLVNVAGSRNVADKCIEYGAEKMVMISTDKAVNPTNIMGCTKRLAEIYVQSLGSALASGQVKGNTKFVTTRFGNVLGSNGSVIPRFSDQISKGGPVTVTHPEITRFFMTIPEACRLVMEAATMTTGNQIFVFDMGESVKIVDLARRMIELAGYRPGVDINIEFTGLRPGEKLYEEVLSNAENTLPTNHDRIRIARVRQYDYTQAKDVVDHLEHLSREVDIPSTVRLMKQTVPEFISKNSEFEKFDVPARAPHA